MFKNIYYRVLNTVLATPRYDMWGHEEYILISVVEALKQADNKPFSISHFRSSRPCITEPSPRAPSRNRLLEIVSLWGWTWHNVHTLSLNLCSAKWTPIQSHYPWNPHLPLREPFSFLIEEVKPRRSCFPYFSSSRELFLFHVEEVKLV